MKFVKSAFSVSLLLLIAVTLSACVNTAELEKNAISKHGFSDVEANYMRSCMKTMESNNLQFKSGDNRVDGCACVVSNNKRLLPMGQDLGVAMAGHNLLMSNRNLGSSGGNAALGGLKNRFQLDDEIAGKILNSNALAMLSCSKKSGDPALDAKIDEVLKKENLKKIPPAATNMETPATPSPVPAPVPSPGNLSTQ